MGKSIYVGNLPFVTTPEELRELFESYGEVISAKVITDRDTGRSRGFGFVEMESDSDANAAIAELNGSQLQGRALRVNEALPRDPRPPRRY